MANSNKDDESNPNGSNRVNRVKRTQLSCYSLKNTHVFIERMPLEHANKEDNVSDVPVIEVISSP
jgi:hypothetical protein